MISAAGDPANYHARQMTALLPPDGRSQAKIMRQ